MKFFMRGFGRASSRRFAIRITSTAALIVGVMVIAGAAGTASATVSGPGTAIGYTASWAYSSSLSAGWMNASFDASSWASDAAPFSDSSPVYCASPYGAAGLPTNANTDFPIGGRIFLRKTFSLPADAWGLHVAGTIDNDETLWVNGTSYGSASGGNCSIGDINVDVPNANLNRGLTSNLAAVEASDSGVATYFTLQATYGAIAFGNQPVETAKNSLITDGTGPIRVSITPPAGGAAVPDGTEVDLTLQSISGSGTLSGGTAFTSGGVASFPDLRVSAPGQYRLVATSGGATVTSNAFVVADQVTTCEAGTACSATGGSTSNTQVTASSSFSGNNQLAVSVIDGGAPIPRDVCPGFSPLGAGTFVNILGTVSGGGNITATWTLAKSLVLQAGNPGAAHFNICLGAENLQGGTTPWGTKNGRPARPVYDANLGATLYWGVLPDCRNLGLQKHRHHTRHGRKHAIRAASTAVAGPCVLHRDKHEGNAIVRLYLPYPWDASWHGG